MKPSSGCSMRRTQESSKARPSSPCEPQPRRCSAGNQKAVEIASGATWIAGALCSPQEAAALAAARQHTLEDFAELVVLVGASGSGKSTYCRTQLPDHQVIALDDLRAARGDRADQSANDAVLRDARESLREALRSPSRVVWDATSLTRRERSVAALGKQYGALVTLVAFEVEREVLEARNRNRQHKVPPGILAKQLKRASFPMPAEGHRLRVVDESGMTRHRIGFLADPRGTRGAV